LRNLQRVCQACSLVIVGEDEDLCLSSQSAKRCGVQNSIAITLEARSPRIGFFLDESVAGSVGSSGEGTQKLVLSLFEIPSVGDIVRSRAGPGIDVSHGDVCVVGVPAHRPNPSGCPFLHRLIVHARTLGEGCSAVTSIGVRHPAHGNVLTDSVQAEECS
jgi:hypothetical protein